MRKNLGRVPQEIDTHPFIASFLKKIQGVPQRGRQETRVSGSATTSGGNNEKKRHKTPWSNPPPSEKPDRLKQEIEENRTGERSEIPGRNEKGTDDELKSGQNEVYLPLLKIKTTQNQKKKRMKRRDWRRRVYSKHSSGKGQIL